MTYEQATVRHSPTDWLGLNWYWRCVWAAKTVVTSGPRNSSRMTSFSVCIDRVDAVSTATAPANARLGRHVLALGFSAFAKRLLTHVGR